MTVHLHVNVDHVATLRQARGTSYPDPVLAAMLCERAGAHGITVHLREDRRHIQDRDVGVLRTTVTTLLNLEMANTAEMVEIALANRPDLVTLVPEKRAEMTTEGGLDVVRNFEETKRTVATLAAQEIPVSLFIDPDPAHVEASVKTGAAAIELHTGDYANASGEEALAELDKLAAAARLLAESGPEVKLAAGHGLTVANLPRLVAAMPNLKELNIGHALVGEAVFDGMAAAVHRFLAAIERGERNRQKKV